MKGSGTKNLSLVHAPSENKIYPRSQRKFATQLATLACPRRISCSLGDFSFSSGDIHSEMIFSSFRGKGNTYGIFSQTILVCFIITMHIDWKIKKSSPKINLERTIENILRVYSMKIEVSA